MKVRPARFADARRVAEIHVASWQTAFRGIMPDAFLDAQNVADRQTGWERNITEHPGNLLVIEDDNGGVRGFTCAGRCTPEKNAVSAFNGQIFGIHVDPSVKGTGFGRMLMHSSFDRLASLGCFNAHLWTLEDNMVARKFYERLGGQIVAHAPINFGGKELIELAYGWGKLVLDKSTNRADRHSKPTP